MPVKRYMTSGPCQKTSKTAITLNPESNFTRREKKHSLFHWNTLTFPELLMDLETCQILGQVSLNWFYWKKNLLTDSCGPGWDWHRIGNAYSFIDFWLIEGNYIYRHHVKHLFYWSGGYRVQRNRDKRAEKLELPMEAAMPCKVKNHQCREPCSKESNTRRSKYACNVEAHESTRKRLERILPKDHEDRIAGQGITILCTNLLRSMKILDAKPAVGKEW